MSAFVMVIDDSPTIRKILETCLHRAGYEVKSFQDGIEALHWCGAPEARVPALVLVDVGLPKLDGYDAIRHFKAKPAWHRQSLSLYRGAMGPLIVSKGGWLGQTPT